MSNDLTRRLEALERRLNAELPGTVQPGAPLRVVIVHGGLLPEPIFATAGVHEWQRQPGEEIEAFAQRCADEAREHGEALLTVSSFPRGEAQIAAAKIAHEEWMRTGYDDVPEVSR
jgi:hypothetical protein